MKILTTLFIVFFTTLTTNVYAQDYYSFVSNEPRSKWTDQPPFIVKIDINNNTMSMFQTQDGSHVRADLIKDYGIKVQNADGSTSAIWTLAHKNAPWDVFKIKYTYYKDYIIEEDYLDNAESYTKYKLVRTNKYKVVPDNNYKKIAPTQHNKVVPIN